MSYTTLSNHVICCNLTYSRATENQLTALLMNFIASRKNHRKQIHFLAIISDVFMKIHQYFSTSSIWNDGKNYPFVNGLCVKHIKYQRCLSKQKKIFISNSTSLFLVGKYELISENCYSNFALSSNVNWFLT